MEVVEVGGLLLWDLAAASTGRGCGSYGWWKLVEASTSIYRVGVSTPFWKPVHCHGSQIETSTEEMSFLPWKSISLLWKYVVASMEEVNTTGIMWWTRQVQQPLLEEKKSRYSSITRLRDLVARVSSLISRLCARLR